MENDNIILAQSVTDLGVKLNQLSIDNNNLKDYQDKYDMILKENNELKKSNQFLSNDNNLIKEELKTYQAMEEQLNETEKYIQSK
ncbi:MAG: hypothetical protein MJY84_09535, partial [Bacteroidales bacterium]|nr:hypothetical protein [Bacteroidales bacterium]